MKVLVCGSRKWADSSMIWNFLEALVDTNPDTEIIHGDAYGADKIAGAVAKALGMKVTAVPADWNRWPKAAGPIRNQQMLDMDPECVVAFRLDGKSVGTDDMIARAQKKGVPVRIVDSRGEVQHV